MPLKMPIFQDPDRQRFYNLWSDDRRSHSRQRHPLVNEEDQRQKALSWSHNHGRSWQPSPDQTNPVFPSDSPALYNTSGVHTNDREELIRYIKSTDPSKWNRPALAGETSAGHCHLPQTCNETPDVRADPNHNTVSSGPPLDDQQLASPADIERPRSALHSGDFREGTPQRQDGQQLPQSGPSPCADYQPPPLGSSPTTPWFSPSLFSSARGPSTSFHLPSDKYTPTARARAPSLGSFSSSYVLKTPTSPLVYQANNTDLDFSPKTDAIDQSESWGKANRRRTLPPKHMQFGVSPGHWNEPSSFQRSFTSPYSLQLASSVQTPCPSARRLSLVSERPAKALAPMVGSYEESILRGRMSTNPSKPLDFTAQIGVLGKGNCKANLRCPPHVTIPFPAVFYSYPTSGCGRSISDDNPSPYVGLIDLENTLPKDTSGASQRRRHHQSQTPTHNGQSALPPTLNDQGAIRKREKKHRRAESPKSPPGGCYRIPQQGQLQIMIKNPNKTAVKLFLVPYDLSDMEPGSKTFFRQRSYSAGPIIDMPLHARKNYGTDRPEASLNTSEDPQDKPILRYMVHLNICSPSRGRFYLHSVIRVVFANRVPDGKESLRNEIQHPEPRYTPYRPSRDSNHSHCGAKLSSQRSSTGRESAAVSHPSPSARTPGAPATREATPGAINPEDTQSHQRPPHPFQPIPSLREESLPAHDATPTEAYAPGTSHYSKLNTEDTGYSRYPFSSFNGSKARESLLAKRLRELEVQKPDPQTMD
ncbi:hypothetical protein P168DRAFT_308635 [Aspergillus campestris IBT 28561]|uniref:Atos-like conserved domain-containing protein n=1 Tax=Aspergillus campestris (strain IBT 28561) TaxID=1392248 RepID=A0A2I1DG33_ASPC2|nr:uncharacterized protein P168DRAFT_308635 [Aspergillus campestris IBT 28561]PKY08830.1 hypothetical protein P168DRAFT_308635 [Aspergillus campestris IBT 28561]